MKVSSAFNGFTTIVILGALLVLFLSEINADRDLRKLDARFNNVQKLKKSKCLQYGHSCWGGHGKRSGVGDIQRPSSLSDDWSLFRLVNPNYKRSSMPELAFILNVRRPPLEVAKEIAMLRHGLVSGNVEDRDEKHNSLASENLEDLPPVRDMYMTDPAADPENNLMQILNENDGA